MWFSFSESWVTLKHGVPPMGYSIGVPIGVPLYCSIWTSFWNILMSYFIYSVGKTMGQDEVSSRNLTVAKPRFRLLTHEVHPRKTLLIFRLRHLYQNFRCHVVALIEVERFRIVTHCYAASFSRKLILSETNNIFYSRHKDAKITKKFDTNITKNSKCLS